MPTSTFNVNNAAVYSQGQFGDFPMNGAKARCWLGSNGRIDFVATGTDCSLVMAVTALGVLTIKVSIDGGAQTTLTLPGTANTYSSVSLFSALPDAAHTVSIQHTAGGITSAGWMVQFNNGISLTGSAPALSAPSGFGPIYPIPASAFAGDCWVEGGALLYIPNNNTGGGGGYGAPPYGRLAWADQLVRFKARCSALKMWCFRNGKKIQPLKDGSPSGSQITLVNDSTWDWVTLFGAEDGTTHEYGVALSDPASWPQVYPYAFMTVGGSLQAPSPAYSRRGLLVGYGDSISVGYGVGNSTSSWLWQLAVAKNREAVNRGVTGSFLMDSYSRGVNGNTGAQDRLSDIFVYEQPGTNDVIVILYGFNDANGGAAASDFQDCYQDMITKVNAAAPNAKVLCLGLLQNTNLTGHDLNGNSTTRTNFNNAISTAVSNLGQANVTYVSTDGWFGTNNTAANYLSDGTHPNATGVAAIVSNLGPSVPAWSASVASGGNSIIGG